MSAAAVGPDAAAMRERAKLIGAKLTVWSKMGEGSEVELQIPAGTAYAGEGKRSWVSELLPTG